MPSVKYPVPAIAIGLLAAALGSSSAQQADSLTLKHRPSANRLSLAFAQLGSIEIDRTFTYVGGRRFILNGVADAEQHLFVVADSARTVQRLVWVQLESRLPGESGAYSYPDSAVNFQGLSLSMNVRAYASPPEPLSDRGSAFRIVETAGYRIPEGALRLRLVYLPEQPARREVMVIYLEPNASSPATMLARANAAIRVLP